MSRGRLLEQLTAQFSSLFFMKDFVLLHPTYLSSGSRRELTDLLLVLNNRCIVISLKGTDGRIKTTERLARWLAKKAFEGSTNAKVAVQRLSRVDITAENLWGEQRHFPARSLKPECGVVLLECSHSWAWASTTCGFVPARSTPA